MSLHHHIPLTGPVAWERLSLHTQSATIAPYACTVTFDPHPDGDWAIDVVDPDDPDDHWAARRGTAHAARRWAVDLATNDVLRDNPTMSW